MTPTQYEKLLTEQAEKMYKSIAQEVNNFRELSTVIEYVIDGLVEQAKKLELKISLLDSGTHEHILQNRCLQHLLGLIGYCEQSISPGALGRDFPTADIIEKGISAVRDKCINKPKITNPLAELDKFENIRESFDEVTLAGIRKSIFEAEQNIHNSMAIPSFNIPKTINIGQDGIAGLSGLDGTYATDYPDGSCKMKKS